MALQLGATRDALINAGADVDLANKASEEIAGYENRISAIERRLTLLQWMMGIQIAVSLGIGAMVFRILAILGHV
jgi:hypothetical protein